MRSMKGERTANSNTILQKYNTDQNSWNIVIHKYRHILIHKNYEQKPETKPEHRE